LSGNSPVNEEQFQKRKESTSQGLAISGNLADLSKPESTIRKEGKKA
jgi:hypothetical protein